MPGQPVLTVVTKRRATDRDHPMSPFELRTKTDPSTRQAMHGG